jgi:hypothetical protein
MGGNHKVVADMGQKYFSALSIGGIFLKIKIYKFQAQLCLAANANFIEDILEI